jgi:Cof subfamily protein (haloacid dehalogenase superfamily)
MKKLIISDLDGTLLRNDKTISKLTFEKIKQWTDLGNYFTINTGRILNSAKVYYDMLGVEIPFICVNGAVIHAKNGDVLIEEYLSKETAKIIYNILKNRNGYFHLYSDAKIYSTGHDGPAKYFKEFHNKYGEEYRIEHHYFDEIDHIDQILDSVHKFGFRISEDFENIKSELDKIKDIQYFKSTADMLDIVSINADKGKGSLNLARLLEIDVRNIIGVGDNENDISMLRDVGYAVAMGDAPNELKELADYVTKTNEEDGIAHLIDHLLIK